MNIILPEGFEKPILEGPLDSNAFMLLGVATKALRRAGVEKASTNAILDEATDGDYNHLLRTLMQYVEFEL